jgi:hypothetical protein
MPFMVRKNMQKIYNAMAKLDEVLAGLTRGMDLSILDTGFGRSMDTVGFYPRGSSLAVHQTAHREYTRFGFLRLH